MWDSIGAVRGEGVSESVAKAPRVGIDGGQKRGISTILFALSGAIGAFASSALPDEDCLHGRADLRLHRRATE